MSETAIIAVSGGLDAARRVLVPDGGRDKCRCPRCAGPGSVGLARTSRSRDALGAGAARIRLTCWTDCTRDEIRDGAIACGMPLHPSEIRGRATPRPRPVPKPGPVSEAPDTAERLATAASLWDAACTADGTPARRYLARRQCWPPDGIGPDLPPAVRWLARADCPAPSSGWTGLPRDAAGALACLMTDAAGNVRAVSLEALDADGRRLAPRWRRTIGPKRGAWMRVGPIPEAGDGLPQLVIAEGELSALASCWLYPGAEAWAAGGTAGLAPRDGQGPSALLSALRTDGRPVVIAADGDGPGRLAALRLITALPDAAADWMPDGLDAADELATELDERAALIADAGGWRIAPDAALAAAWRCRLDWGRRMPAPTLERSSNA